MARPSWDYVAQMIAENQWTLQQAARQMACSTGHVLTNLQVAARQGAPHAATAIAAIKAGGAATTGGGIMAVLGATVPAWVGAALLVAAVGTGIWVASEWGEPSIGPVERSGFVQQVIDEREALPDDVAHEPEVVIPDDSGAGLAEYYLVVVGNVSPPIYSVRSKESVDGGDLLTCQFLNGGLCAGTTVDTPNGPVEAGADITAAFSAKELFTADDDSDAKRQAWERLCSELEGIRVAPLAAGYIGFRGEQMYTIDEANWFSPNPNPCGFE